MTHFALQDDSQSFVSFSLQGDALVKRYRRGNPRKYADAVELRAEGHAKTQVCLVVAAWTTPL